MSKIAAREPARWIVGSAGAYRGIYITETNALVKFGPHVFPSREAATMKYVLQSCPDIPVPVVYDFWTGDDGFGYISMAPMPGKDLDEIWPELDSLERESVMKDYKAILQRLRALDPSPDTPIQIGAIDGGPAVDHRPSDRRSSGPFSTEAELNNWLLSLIHPDYQEYHSDFFVETVKGSMRDNHKWRMTHGDMGPHNILVENGRITAVLDWELAGWYPEYWEYVKMIQYLPFECDDFKSYARRLWSVGKADVFYDVEYMIDQTLDSQVVHGERVIKRPR
ncbi:MAG: hypothetical protein ALECFALPRED_002876 [Alectoria fallacina]|uniref:Aminoglycoside phosphotransferase domain-containing protein n=1 Tax=Alectoria fallacina TaxID=1903189 RepID=A0A8H3IRR1_9LECA|nr:MAG: hypothetical protein ALECFALPRED_002876 [Alectoria fallacina]